MFLLIPTAHANSCHNGATSFTERAHRGRFVGKYSTVGQSDNFARILRLKVVGEPHFFLDTLPSLTNFCQLSKNGQKINVGSLFLFPFSTPARSNSAHFEALRVRKCNYLRLVLLQGTSKVKYIRVINLPK